MSRKAIILTSVISGFLFLCLAIGGGVTAYVLTRETPLARIHKDLQQHEWTTESHHSEYQTRFTGGTIKTEVDDEEFEMSYYLESHNKSVMLVTDSDKYTITYQVKKTSRGYTLVATSVTLKASGETRYADDFSAYERRTSTRTLIRQ